jgi:predicted kinase
MDALDINLWDEPRRAKIEELQWTLAQQLLKLGIKVIIEWGTWGRSERDTLRLGARAPALQSSCIILKCLLTYYSSGYAGAGSKTLL